MKAVRKVFDGETWSLEEARKAMPLLKPMTEYHNGKKVYHIAGRRFCIVSINRPADHDLVYFTDREWAYLKSQNLSAEEFAVQHDRKRANHTYSAIPDEVELRDRATAMATCRNVLELLKKKSTP
jgi:hypothetical protein